MSTLTRREFLAAVGALSAAGLAGPLLRRLRRTLAATARFHVYIARNSSPVSNVQQAIALAGGIQRFIGREDVIVLKPNGQWQGQGYTHTECLKALIDVILAHPGGFAGEIIIAENVHRSPAETLAGRYCWNMQPGDRFNNWPDMNYLELVADYHRRGIPIVTANPLYDSDASPDWEPVSSPAGLGPGKQGWVRSTYTTAANGRPVSLAYPILRSSYSGKLIDLKNGVWQNGGYTGQPVKLIFLPTLNNHGSFNSEDYAGPTSAVKCHLGIVDFDRPGGTYTLHNAGYDSGRADGVGEAVGHLVTQLITPTFYLTCAEYAGHRSRTDPTAARTRTVGLCADPVTLDYWMCKYVMLPAAPSQTFMNPARDNNLRKTLLGCHSRGVGTLDEAEIAVHLADANTDRKIFLPMLSGG